MPKYKILKLKADKLILLGLTDCTEHNGYNVLYKIDADKPAIYSNVVEEQLVMDNCALFDQFSIVLGKEECKEDIREWLLQELVIVDFTNIFKSKSELPEELVEGLITGGFILKYCDKEVHMLPFDRSGNMSRKCRLSFINAEKLGVMNDRLNLGIPFNEIELNLSKYYAYRGLYLSTARRIENSLIEITPETLVVVGDNLEKDFSNYRLKVHFEEGVVDGNDHSKISFKKYVKNKEDINVPFDGQGIISPFYADLIIDELEDNSINSFQIRLPFSKGMLHRVDFHVFLREFDSAYNADTYIMKDAFGIDRDLKLANIVMTKSMFKCFDWLKKHCGDTQDPMQFYCDAIKKYQHSLYISSTDMPYGNSKVTHISYQLLNTLALSEKQFNSLIEKQFEYIHNPIRYIEDTKGQCIGDGDEDEIYYDFSNWQKAVLQNPNFARLSYIKNQLKNTQTSLMTKLALGKLVVKGQTRYMMRDLPFMLVNMITDKAIRSQYSNFKIFDYKFYLPQGKEGNNHLGLDYYTHYGFFRSPHLSRNEQGVLAPLIKNDSLSDSYKEQCDIIDKYFGHLTGVVMFGDESLEPMALGGADFDGDLVCMIMDSDVVDSIKTGVYEKVGKEALQIARKETMPYIKIPSIDSNNVVVPRIIPYLQIKNTFSNKIGLISNAAIALGQYEYGNKKGEHSNVTCSQCTILTGLEIDAAKNGVHPDLSMLTMDENLSTCAYLDFKKDFEKLKKYKDYHFNQLKSEKDGKEYTLELNGTKKKIKYIEEAGTYINKLPVIFMENLNPKLNIPKTNNKEYFSFPEVEYNVIEENGFIEDCKTIFDSYTYFSKLYKYICKHNVEDKYSDLKLKKLLHKQYDVENADKIIIEILPYLYNQIAEVMSSYKIYKNIEKFIKEKTWHLLCTNDKKKFLCDILDVNQLDEEKWSIVLQSNNHCYKILWHIVQEIGSKLIPEYEDLKAEFNKGKKYCEPQKTDISKQTEQAIRGYLNKKDTGVSTQIYNIHLTVLRNLVNAYELPLSKKIELLFNSTKESSKNSQFFWECFEWDELLPYIVKEEAYAE